MPKPLAKDTQVLNPKPKRYIALRVRVPIFVYYIGLKVVPICVLWVQSIITIWVHGPFNPNPYRTLLNRYGTLKGTP